MLSDDSSVKTSWPSLMDKHNGSNMGIMGAECYLQKRRYSEKQAHKQEEREGRNVKGEGYHDGLNDFQSVLSTFTRYSRLRVIAELRHGVLFHSADIISSFSQSSFRYFVSFLQLFSKQLPLFQEFAALHWNDVKWVFLNILKQNTNIGQCIFILMFSFM